MVLFDFFRLKERVSTSIFLIDLACTVIKSQLSVIIVALFYMDFLGKGSNVKVK